MGKGTTATASPKSSQEAAEAAHGHHDHRHHLLHHHHHHKAKPVPPPVAKADRFECSDDINDCADAFIKHFRQQLDLQRMQSIENYHQMLARGL